jgi:hypothetical protein
MWQQNQDVELELGSLGARACVELFGAYGIELTRGAGGWGENDERLLSGSVGFIGRRLRGTCLLAAPERPIAASCPERDGAIRDWVGELTNQFVGRLKTKLLARGVEVFVTTPIVLSGVRIEPLPRSRAEPAMFTSSAGPVLAWVEVETQPHFVLGSEHPGQSGEGDVIVLGGDGDLLLF